MRAQDYIFKREQERTSNKTIDINDFTPHVGPHDTREAWGDGNLDSFLDDSIDDASKALKTERRSGLPTVSGIPTTLPTTPSHGLV